MLKHKTIIEKLSVKQKIALLTDIKCLSDPEYSALGIPYTSLATLEDMICDTNEGINSKILARSWNIEGLKELTEAFVGVAKAKGVNFVIGPSPKIKISPYTTALSEDPCLSGAVAGAYLSAIHKTGIPGCVSGFRFDGEDVEYLDIELSKRVLHDYFVEPFKIAADQGECRSIIASVSGPENGYGDLNLKLMRSAEAGLFDVNMNVLCDEHTPEATAEVWHEGGIVIEGVSLVLEHAYEKYQKILKAIHEGHATVDDLEDAYADGSAISEDMMDDAVDKVIDFAFSCSTEQNNDTVDQEEDAYNEVSVDSICEDIEVSEPIEEESGCSDKILNAIRESIVLLKNESSVLPITQGKKIAVIGDTAISAKNENFVSALFDHMGAESLYTSKGYAINNDKNKAYIDEAVDLVQHVDVVLLFLSMDTKRMDKLNITKRLELPANQLALIDALKPYSQKIVAIVSGDILPAANFSENVGAFMLAPIGGNICAMALADVLTGRYNPSGKLTETYFNSPSEYFKDIKKNKDAKKNKIGPFMGYRLYDSSQISVDYPFGYGLSYANFQYSNLSVNGKTVSFYLRNLSPISATEIVQVYLGKKDSRYIRPLKELNAFARVELRPNEEKLVSIDISEPSVFDEDMCKAVTEDGQYNVYIGASVSDIRLEGIIDIRGSLIYGKKTDENISDYLQSESNILFDKYTLEVKCREMKRSIKWTIGYIMGIVIASIVNAILFNVKSNFDGQQIIYKIILGLIITFNIFAFLIIGFAIVMDIVTIIRFKKMRKKDREEKRDQQFSDANFIENVDIDELFIKEFDDVVIQEKKQKKSSGFDLADYSRFVNEGMNFSVVHRALAQYAQSRGIVFKDDFSAVLMSSMASSRLVLVNSQDNKDIKPVTQVLCDYFGIKEYFENIDESFVDGNLLVCKSNDEEIRQTAVLDMIKEAVDHKDKIYFVTLTDLTSDLLINLFSQYIRYLNNPERQCKISVGDEKYIVPENVWFFVSMKQNENFKKLPVYMAELISSVNLDYATQEIIENENDTVTVDDIQTLGYYQFSFMAEKCRHGSIIPEEIWKKVDSLQEYATKHSSYRFGNKLWLRLEKYLAVLYACEIEMAMAIDNALASNLLHVLQIVLDEKLKAEDRGLLEALELFFGEDNVPLCRKLLKSTSVVED